MLNRALLNPTNRQVVSSVDRQTSASPSTSSASQVSLSIDSCELLSVEDMDEVGEFESKYKEGGGARSCFWQESSAGGGDVFTFVLSVRDSQGIDAVNDIGGGVDLDEVNQRPAVTTQDPKTGDCTLAMKLSGSSRVDVTVLGEDGSDDSCDIAKVIAGMFEPRLPAIP